MGILALLIGLLVLGFGLTQHFKGKRILAAPYKKTGELARNPVSPDPKGAMSTEGKVLAPAQELLSPCSKQPCLYYEVKIERLYEKTETTQDGTKTVKGSDTLDTLKGGAICGLDDGTGAVMIDFAKGADFDNFKDGFKRELNGNGGSSNIRFGELNYDVPLLSGKEGWTTGFKVTEKLVPVAGELFVLGKLEGGKIVKPSWRSMLASSKGREGLLGSVNKKKKFSFIGGGVVAALSIPLMIFGPRGNPNAPSASCEHTLTDARAKCSATVSAKSGDDYTWKVTRAGKYDLSVIAPAKKISFYPELVVQSASGEEIDDVSGGVGEAAKTTVDVKAGEYKLIVKPADGYMVKGGFSYDLQIISQNPKAAPKGAAVAAAATNEDADANADADAEVDEKPIVIDAPVLAAKYLSSGMAFNGYDDKVLEVKGLVKAVEKVGDETVVEFMVPTADDKFQGVFAHFPVGTVAVKKGQVITARGEAFVDGDSFTVHLNDTKLVANAVPGKRVAVAAVPKPVVPVKAAPRPAATGGRRSNKMAP